MKFEIVESIPERTPRTSFQRGSKYDTAIFSALSGKVVKIPCGSREKTNNVQACVSTLVKRRGLPVRVVIRQGDVYLERKDV